MIHRAKDLSPEQIAMIESLLGRRVLEEESISIRTLESSFIADERRREAVDALRRYFAEVDASRQTGSADQAGEILSEAMRSTRIGSRPQK
jgi:hypothetical protein